MELEFNCRNCDAMLDTEIEVDSKTVCPSCGTRMIIDCDYEEEDGIEYPLYDIYIAEMGQWDDKGYKEIESRVL